MSTIFFTVDEIIDSIIQAYGRREAREIFSKKYIWHTYFLKNAEHFSSANASAYNKRYERAEKQKGVSSQELCQTYRK